MSALKVAVFGLGSMGYGIAQSLIRAGHDVYGFDISPDPVARLQAEGGAKAESITEVAGDLDAAVVVVLNAAQTESVLFGDSGVVAHLKPGAVVLSCATVSPDFAIDMEKRCESLGVAYVDSPISGGSVKAANGELSIMAAAKPAAFEAAQPVLDATAQTVFKLGDSAGPGSAMKAANQLLAGVHIAVMAEALTFGITQGIEPKKFVEVISQCAGTSWMLENRAPHIVEGDYTPHSAVDIWLKDLGIVLDIAKGAKFAAPITAAALQQFVATSGSGLGREDDSAVAKIYARNAGVKLPGVE